MIPPTPADIHPYGVRLCDDYMDYGRTVSPRAMAVNIQTAAVFWWAADQLEARAVCDLGSGFSSYVAQRYATESGRTVRVASVDDDETWLVRTRRFLARHRLPTSGLASWDEWSATDDTFDVILHDFAKGETRNKTMWIAAERLRPGGVLIFDDAQNEGHQAEMHNVAEAYDLELHSLYPITTDETGRYAAMAVA